MPKKYNLKINNCWECPNFKEIYVRNHVYYFYCLKTDKYIQYKDPEVYEKIKKLFNQCPLEEWNEKVSNRLL